MSTRTEPDTAPDADQRMCGVERTTRRHLWRCIRPFHGGDHPAVDDHRRREGKSVGADNHIMVRVARLSETMREPVT